MKQRLTQFLTVIGLASLLLAPALVVPVVSYAACDDNLSVTSGADCTKTSEQRANLFSGPNAIFKTISNVLLFLIGAVSVIMLIVGGIRYTISQGDSTQVAAAKNTILYAIIGIVVALLAYALVNFVVQSFAKG